MEKDLSNLHLGTDGLYYEDYVAPEEPGRFTGKLVSRQWWHHGSRFALICNFLTENGQRIALFAFQKETGFYGPRYGGSQLQDSGDRHLVGMRGPDDPNRTLHMDLRPKD